MSANFIFVLDEQDPQEKRALEILQARLAQGYTLQQVMVSALLALDDQREQGEGSSAAALANAREVLRQMQELLNHRASVTFAETNRVLRETRELLAQLQQVRSLPAPEAPSADTEAEAQPDEEAPLDLPLVFLSAVKKAARPGMRLEE
jgi:hypothetical protein